MALVLTAICTTLGLVATQASATTTPPPAVVMSLRAAPGELGSSGGHFEVNGTVKHAKSCQLKLLSSHSLPVGYSHNAKKCTSRNYSAHVVVGANVSAENRTLSFVLVATNQTSSLPGGSP